MFKQNAVSASEILQSREDLNKTQYFVNISRVYLVLILMSDQKRQTNIFVVFCEYFKCVPITIIDIEQKK